MQDCMLPKNRKGKIRKKHKPLLSYQDDIILK